MIRLITVTGKGKLTDRLHRGKYVVHPIADGEVRTEKLMNIGGSVIEEDIAGVIEILANQGYSQDLQVLYICYGKSVCKELNKIFKEKVSDEMSEYMEKNYGRVKIRITRTAARKKDLQEMYDRIMDAYVFRKEAFPRFNEKMTSEVRAEFKKRNKEEEERLKMARESKKMQKETARKRIRDKKKSKVKPTQLVTKAAMQARLAKKQEEKEAEKKAAKKSKAKKTTKKAATKKAAPKKKAAAKKTAK